MLLFVQQFFATEIVSANFAELIAENSNAEESKNEEFKAPPKPLTFELRGNVGTKRGVSEPFEEELRERRRAKENTEQPYGCVRPIAVGDRPARIDS